MCRGTEETCQSLPPPTEHKHLIIKGDITHNRYATLYLSLLTLLQSFTLLYLAVQYMVIDILLTRSWEFELVTHSLGLGIIKIFATNCTPLAMNAELHPAFPFCFTIGESHFVLYAWLCSGVKIESGRLIIIHACIWRKFVKWHITLFNASCMGYCGQTGP